MLLHLFLAFYLFAFFLVEQQKIAPSNWNLSPLPNSSIFIDDHRNSNTQKRMTINNSAANSNSPLEAQKSNKFTMPWENFNEQKPISSSATSTLSSSSSSSSGSNLSSSSSHSSKLSKKQIVAGDSIRAPRRRKSKLAQKDEDYEDRIETSTPGFQPAIRTYLPRRDAQSAEFLFPFQQEEEVKKNGATEMEQIEASSKEMSNAFQVSTVPLMRLTKDVLAPGRYDVRVRPVNDYSKSLKIHISMSLYQIIEVNEPAQNIKMNVWMIQKWQDQMLHWDPREYDMINTTILPHEVLWIPDTYLYNSVVMNAEETERYMNIRADSLYWEGQQGSNMSFLYPAIYTVTCRLNIRYFPYDQQNCTLTISSWTNSKSALDYYADPEVNLASFIANEEWDVMSFRIFRHEYKYACCPEPWVILEASIVLRRKPLYYVINLIIPTSIITLVAITGFFTPASTADDRTEKINLGITTLLAMSILMLMVSDQMPTTSEFVPLIAWFYLSIIIIISIGTFLTSVILSIQGRRQYGQLPSLWIRHIFFVKMAKWLWISIPPPLLALWEEMNDHPLTAMEKLKKAEEEKKEGKRFQKSLRRSLKNSQKSNKAPSVAFEGDGSVVIQASPKDMSYRSQPIGGGILSPVNEDGNMDWGGGEQQPQSSTSNGSSRAKRNWLRVSSIMSKRSNQSNRTGGTPPSPRSPQNEAGPPPIQLNMMNSISRRSSEAATNWENAIGGLGVVTPRPKDPLISSRGKLVNKTVSVSAEVNSMKVKRQCSLEWEFLSTILDRLFLIIFSITTLIVTLGMMFTGRVAQWQYEMAARNLG